MIQDIAPSKIHNEFRNCTVSGADYLLFFDKDGKILLGKENKLENTKAVFPTASDLDTKDMQIVYLFSIDDRKFFLALNETMGKPEGMEYYTVREVRDQFIGKEVFAVFTAYHLWKWYSDNIFCGKCAEKLEIDEKERALRCPKCGNVIYPRINPAVIVGVTKGDSILITKYKTGYAHNALVAGFTEIGETLEETVAREVMEETGVKVKNIRYYKSQPWGMAQDLLVGFYCEADGDGEIHMDENELKYAEWVKREDIVLQPNNFSLTNEMMKVFKEGENIENIKISPCGTLDIETDRLLLRAFRYEDGESMIKNWAGDDYVQKMYGEPAYKTPEEIKGLLDNYISKYSSGYYYRWGIFEKESGECIGMVAYFLVDTHNNFGEIEYCIGTAFQGKGYATEATKAVIEYGFEQIHFNKVQISVRPANISSCKVIEKCGFTYEGTLRDYFLFDGEYEGRMYYSILKDEYHV